MVTVRRPAWPSFRLRALWPAAAALAVACGTALPNVAMPAGLIPVADTAVAAWVASTTPAASAHYRFSWKYRDPDQSYGGRGEVRVVPPDSIRLDFRGALGVGAGSAAVVGDSTLWAEPADQARNLVPNYPLLWGMIGVARPPAPGWSVEARRDPGARAWRYTRGSDTVDYIRVTGAVPLLEVYVRETGKGVGRVVTTLSPDGRPLRSRLDVMINPARIDITYDTTAHATNFGKDIWDAPHQQ